MVMKLHSHVLYRKSNVHAGGFFILELKNTLGWQVNHFKKLKQI